MKVSAQWLREWVNPSVSNAEMAEKLTMAGLEVDGIEPAAPEFTGIVVAKVESVAPHPDADKLRICQVNKGDETVQIVCGAPNVREGMLAPLATVGGVLTGKDDKPFKIKKAKLRGVESFGMLCSAVELGLATDADGLWDLPQTLTVGADIRAELQLNDDVIDIDLTPNRADALSIRGIAREVGVLTRSNVTEPEFTEIAATTDAVYTIGINAQDGAADACPCYLLRVVEGIDNQTATPLWIVECLRRAGIKPLTPAVDVTNYVLLELGQPMHAFDREKLQGDLRVRFAEEGESIELLNGQIVTLAANSLVIADDAGAVALAGVMGGLRTSVSETTKNIVFESAHFVPTAIAGRARQYGLHTDSSHRFERGVDPQLPEIALERATELLLGIAAGNAGSIVRSGLSINPPKPVGLRRDRIEQVLGISLEDVEIVEILQRLDMQVEATDDGWQVTPPSARFDVEIEVDLIEELVRIHGYDQVPVNSAMTPMTLQPQPENRRGMAQVRQVLVQRDYAEAITYSFVSPDMQQQLFPEVEAIALANPISADLSVMRVSTWPGLLAALQHNVNRQQPRVRLFETGLKFVPDANNTGEIVQTPVMGGVAYGNVQTEHWDSANGAGRVVDFYDVKGDVEALLVTIAANSQLEFVAGEHGALHPGQCAEIHLDGEMIGLIGALHPQHASKLGLSTAPLLFELDLAAVCQRKLPAFAGVSKFPTVRRDLALVVDKAVPAAQLQQTAVEVINNAQPDVQVNAWVFDVFTGGNLQNQQKSIALALVLQDISATLTDEVVESAVSLVVQELSNQFAAEIRS